MKDVIPSLRAKNPNLRWINYFPIDGKPKSKWVEAMALADYPITYTEWGKGQCVEMCPGVEKTLGVIPHGVNVKDFYPLPKGQAEAFRRSYFGSLASKFIVLNVNRNQQRKDIPRSMMAFKKFHDQRPNSVFYIHAAVEDHGWNLVEVAKSLGLEVNKDICFPNDFGPNQGFPVDVVNSIYNASDVVVSTTTGEGWGLAQVEAMACCKPVISPDNTSCTEIVKGHGVLVRSGWCPEAFTVLPHDNEVIRPLASVEDMTEALVSLHDDAQKRSSLSVDGYKWVTSSLRWDKHIVPLWVKVFEKASEERAVPSFGRPVSLVEL
jgi:glycosyltransferase involved in cell wall biosynthesis